MTGNWDRGLDYSGTYRRLVKDIKENRDKKGERSDRRHAYLAIYLMQLRNGARVSEALDTIKRWVATGDTVFEDIKVRKIKTGEELRRMLVPTELSRDDRMKVKAELDGINVDNTSSYAIQKFGWNTHSLRYSFITHLARRGVAPQIIAKITKHRKLDFILRYTSQKLADDILDNLGV